jgi:hypothetical protein
MNIEGNYGIYAQWNISLKQEGNYIMMTAWMEMENIMLSKVRHRKTNTT